MAKKTYMVRGKIWLYPGVHASWHFVSIDKKQSADIKERYGKHAKGFRSLPVSVTIGDTSWETSIFPSSSSGMYILPLKAKVRQAEGLFEGDEVRMEVRIR